MWIACIGLCQVVHCCSLCSLRLHFFFPFENVYNPTVMRLNARRARRRCILARTLFAVSFVLPFCHAARTSLSIAKGQCEGWRMPDARRASTVHTFEGSCNSLVVLYYFNHTKILRHVTELFSTHDTTYRNIPQQRLYKHTQAHVLNIRKLASASRACALCAGNAQVGKLLAAPRILTC